MKGIGGFILGATIGGGAAAGLTYYLVKKKCREKIDAEVESVKQCLKEYYAHPAEDTKEEVKPEGSNVTWKEDASSIKKMDKTEKDYKDYGKPYRSANVERKLEAAEAVAKESEMSGDIYVITPEEFNDSHLEAKTLYLYSDNVVSDSDGRIVDDYVAIIGNAANHIGEYEADSAYVRNEKLDCDFEVIAIDRPYSARPMSERVID